MHTYKISRWFATAVIATQLVMPVAPVFAQETFIEPSADTTTPVEVVVAETPVVEETVVEPVAEEVVVTEPETTVVTQESIDADGDGLTNTAEKVYQTDPESSDTDGDGFSDSTEILNNYDPKLTPEEEVVAETAQAEAAATSTTETSTIVVPTPVLTTDKADYAPTDLVTIFGNFFQSLYNFVLKIVGGSADQGTYVEHTANITTDANGEFTYQYQLDGLYRPTYSVTASSTVGDLLAQASFTDSSIGTYDQCSNDIGEGYGSGDTGCRWTNGNLQPNNSRYFEHDATVQRAWLTGFLPGSTHTLTLKYGTTKGGKHAYDFLTTWDHSENWVSLDDRCQDITGCITVGETTLAIPVDINANGIDSGTRDFVMRGGTLTSATTPTIVSGTYAGDSETVITVNFTVAASGDMCTTQGNTTSCGVALWFGAHVSSQADWGAGQSAVNISGSPYHVALDAVDGAAVGQRDNQMQSATVLQNSTITIIKDAVPDSAQDFNFTTTGTGLSSFSLDDDANGTLSNIQTFSGLASGTYTVTEGAVTNWSLTNLVCVDPTTNTTVNIGTRTATINLAAGETVTCTYTNTLQTGHIIVDKVTNPSGDLQSFSFSTTGTGYVGFSLTDAAVPNDQTLNAGAYTVSETVPSGWDLTSATCVSSIQDPETIGNLELDPNETIICTFTNTKRGHIIVVKDAVPNDAEDFTFSIKIGDTDLSVFNLDDDSDPTLSNTRDSEVLPGTYSVAESPVTGWIKTSAICSDGSPVNEIVVSPGETVTCTFTNTKRGHIIVDKITFPAADQQSFDFITTGVGYTGFSLTDAAAPNNQEVVPGAYTVAETAVTGWDLTSATCDQGETPASLDVEPGETVTCTFTNTKRGHIIVDKITDPSGDPQSFDFTTTGVGYTGFSLTDAAAPNNSGDLDPGTYSVSETVPAGWDLASATCSEGTPASISLQAGETVTCTFNNQKDAKIIVQKVTVGGDASFEFDPSYSSNFFLSNGQSNDSFDLAPGTYSVAEVNIPQGWNLTSATCTDGTPASISLQAGETVTCIFTNTKDGTITIEKQTLPNGDPAEFAFAGDVAGLLSDGETSTQSVAPGQYDSTETALAGWDLTSIVCSDANSSGVIGTGVATFNVEPGESVTCVFTNTKRGHIIVDKVTNPSGAPTSFSFNTTGGTDPAYTGFSLTDATAPNNQELKPGAYSVSELQNLSNWDLTNTVCVSSIGDNETAGNLELDAGETITCTFTNTQRGKILVDKVTDPSGHPQSFSFTSSWGPFSLTDAASPAPSGFLVPGTYSVSETVPTGWDLTSATCSDGSDPANISLGAGETVTCTFNNQKDSYIIVDKVTDPSGDTQSFTFNTSGAGYAGFSLTDAAAPNNSGDLDPGTYSVAEVVPAGWDLTSVYCGGAIDGPLPSAWNTVYTPGDPLQLDAGETITCTFTNQKDANIIVIKQTYPDGSNQVFGFTASYDVDGFSLSDGQQNDSGDLVPGTYSVSETIPAGWAQTSATCTDGTPGSISLQAGETVTCTFTNTKPDAKITLTPLTATNKVDDPHVVTATVMVDSGSGFVTAPDGTLVTFTLPVNTAGASFVGSSTCNTTAGSCSISITSAAAGLVQIHAATDVSPLGVALHRETTGLNGNSGNAAKTYVDAKIVLSPLQDTNKVSDPHTITATVTQNNGLGWSSAPDGTLVTFSLVNNNNGATFVSGINTCTTTGGTCSVQINTSSTGGVDIHAITTFSVGGVSLTRASDSTHGSSGDAHKDYVDARISIGTSGTNKINEPHTFTVTVEKNNGSGWVAASGVTITPSETGIGSLTGTGTCETGTTDGSGQCTIIVTSTLTGQSTVNAAASVSVNGLPINVATNGYGANSVSNTKTWVDARISIGTSGTNEVGDEHTFTVTVEKNNGSGWVAASGVTVTPSEIGVGDITYETCTTGTDVDGECIITVDSSSTGQSTVNASAIVNVDGVNVNAATNGYGANSVSNTKTWVDLQILSTGDSTNPIESAHTFTITVNKDIGNGVWVPVVGAAVNTSWSGTGSITGGTCPTTNASGECTVIVNSSNPGTGTLSASTTVDVGGVDITRELGDGVSGDSAEPSKTWEAGALQVTKVVELGNVVNPTAINDTFTVTVTGPSYPGGHQIVFTVTNGVLQAPTSVTLDPVIPGNYTITEADSGVEWTETVPAGPVTVVANQTAQATVTNTYVPGALDVTKSLVLTGYLFPNDVDQVFTINVSGPSYPLPAGTDLVFNVVNGVLNPVTQSLTNLIPGTYTVTEANPGVMWTVTGNGTVEVSSGNTASKTVTNTIKLPHTTISMTADTYEAFPDQNVTITITDINDGQVPISNPSVELLANGVPTVTQPTYVSGDTNNNGIMDVGETWTWTWVGVIGVNTDFTVNGIGTDPLGNPVNGPTYVTETDTITVRVIGTTRTLGFWQTHTTFTTSVFTNQLGSSILIGNGTTHKGPVETAAKVFGGFYAPIAKTTTGTKRTPIDQARIQMLQQLLAAKLNCAAFGCSTTTMALIASADAAYAAGTNKNLIISLAGQLDTFNNSGDSGAIPPALGPTGKATPKVSQSLADKAFWNLP